MLRYHLFDVDLVIINRTLVYGTLTASVVGLYVLVVGLLGTLLQARENVFAPLLAAGLVAALCAPLRNRLAAPGVGGVSVDPLRILIADDHTFFRDGLRVLLEATPDTRVSR